MLFIRHNSSTLHWRMEATMAFIQHKAEADSVPIKFPVMRQNVDLLALVSLGGGMGGADQ